MLSLAAHWDVGQKARSRCPLLRGWDTGQWDSIGVRGRCPARCAPGTRDSGTGSRARCNTEVTPSPRVEDARKHAGVGGGLGVAGEAAQTSFPPHRGGTSAFCRCAQSDRSMRRDRPVPCLREVGWAPAGWQAPPLSPFARTRRRPSAAAPAGPRRTGRTRWALVAEQSRRVAWQ